MSPAERRLLAAAVALRRTHREWSLLVRGLDESNYDWFQREGPAYHRWKDAQAEFETASDAVIAERAI